MYYSLGIQANLDSFPASRLFSIQQRGWNANCAWSAEGNLSPLVMCDHGCYTEHDCCL